MPQFFRVYQGRGNFKYPSYIYGLRMFALKIPVALQLIHEGCACDWLSFLFLVCVTLYMTNARGKGSTVWRLKRIILSKFTLLLYTEYEAVPRWQKALHNWKAACLVSNLILNKTNYFLIFRYCHTFWLLGTPPSTSNSFSGENSKRNCRDPDDASRHRAALASSVLDGFLQSHVHQ